MKRQLSISFLFLMICGLAHAERPNILIVLCDDLGYGDISCFGNDIVKTPNLQEFAEQSLKLTSCYAAAPNCSPARTGLMTGRTPYRVGVYNWIPFLSPIHVRESEVTIAHLMQKAGYQTCHVGKWHLNGWFNLPGQPQPDEMGFDHWFSTQNNALPNHRHPYNFVRNGIPVGTIPKYAAHCVVDEATNWLDARQAEQPFFMYLCFHEPHEPIATDEEYASQYPYPDEPSLRAHHGNITQMDDAFGKLMRYLDEHKLSESTLIIFTSDNGPALTNRHPHGSAGPLRMHKGHLYEGGIRVPGLVRWPGVTEPGSQSDVPVSSVDFLPTLCAVAEVELPQNRTLDGTDILPLLKGGTFERSQPLYWQFNYARSSPKVAIRDGDWKLLASHDPADQGNLTDISADQMKALKSSQIEGFELYNLADDIGETKDLSKSEPAQLKRMVALMKGLYHDVQAEGPVWPEWEWPHYEGQRIEWPEYPIPKRKPSGN